MLFSQEVVELICGEYACRGSEFEADCDEETEVTGRRISFPTARKELATNVALVSKAFYAAASRVVWEWVVICRKDDLENVADNGSRIYGARTSRLDVAIDFRGKKHAQGTYEKKKLTDLLENMPHLRVLVVDNTFDSPSHPSKVVPIRPEVIQGVLQCSSILRLELLSTSELLQGFDFMRIAHECPGLKTLVVQGITSVSGERRFRPAWGYKPLAGTKVLPALERLCMGKPGARFLPQVIPLLYDESSSPRLTALRRLDMRYTSQGTECEGWWSFLDTNGPHLNTLEWVVGTRVPRSWLDRLTGLKTLILTLRKDDASGSRVHGWPKPNVKVLIVQPEEAFIVPEDTHATWIGLLKTIVLRAGPRLKEIRMQRVDWIVNQEFGVKVRREVGEELKGGDTILWFGKQLIGGGRSV
ncbi:hypothetical protein DFP72DRAFT_1048033 [Ephemerocybe angulata]|uniref:Uncharacterized protein n=1 Tax=Ephemerocybe angulata TaxID=980116 RepID=A0A8H6HQ97_9AGAR|nr:hypothetical protein DFP72DRAFT_1048033 [Tulosesus angulatus]